MSGDVYKARRSLTLEMEENALLDGGLGDLAESSEERGAGSGDDPAAAAARRTALP